MKVYFNSFSTPDFRPYLDELAASASKFGINDHIIYDLADLERSAFYQQHRDTFQQKKGFGYWLWKPFFVLQALNKIENGDVLFYIDAASLIIEDPKPLIDIALNNESGIVAFDAWPLHNSQWVKRDTFINMHCDSPEFWEAKHVIATLFLIRKSDSTVNFVSEWLTECENIGSLSDRPNVNGLDNLPDFVSHRMDQSVLSLLVARHNLETYRNPSKWGNFLKLSRYRVPGEHISSPYSLPPQTDNYSDEPYLNSPYGTIMEFNRRAILKPAKTFRQRLLGIFQK